jgi:hypothetical protein
MLNKKKLLKNIGIGLALALIFIQFFHTEKNLSNDNTNYISNVLPVPDSIQQILRTSCNDCHSNYTEYPWYASIQPVDWWLQDHVVEGKKHLNFSEFSTYRIYRQFHKLEETIELVKKDEMPLPSYLWVHGNARLNAQQKVQLVSWAQSLCDTLKARYPADSLVNPKKRKSS